MHVIPSMNIGGREKVVLDVLEHIDKKRFIVEVACLGRRGSLYHAFRSKHVTVHFLNKQRGFSPRVYFQLRRLITEKRFDIVHSHNPGAFLYGAIAAILAKVSTIINSEHGYADVISWRKRIAESILTNRISRTLAVSKDLASILSNRPFARKSNIQILHNGIDVDKFSSSKKRAVIRESIGIKDPEILIGTVARLAAVKGHETLIRSFRLIRYAFSEAKLLIVGDGDRKEVLQNLVRELNLRENVIFAGQRSDIPDVLSAMDIFVLSSLNEGLSITLLEAMASGLPVVATSVGGNLEVVENGISGLLVPSNDAEKMAEALNSIITDKSIPRSFGEAAKRRVREHFGAQRMVKDLETIYETDYKDKAAKGLTSHT